MNSIILTIRHLLASFRLAGSEKEGNIQFRWHEAGDYGLSGSAVFTLFIDRRLLRHTAIDVIRQHSTLFEEQSVETVSRLLTDFARSSISVLGPGKVFSAIGKDQSLLEFADDDVIEMMSSQLQTHLNNSGHKFAYLLPLPEVQLSGEIASDRLFLSQEVRNWILPLVGSIDSSEGYWATNILHLLGCILHGLYAPLIPG